MSDAQLSIYEQQKADKANELAECFENDLSSFLLKVSYSQDAATYYSVPIFQEIDENRFANASLEYLKNGHGNILGEVFDKLAERHNADGDWLEEVKWFHSLREKLESRATEYSRLARAQLEHFFGYHWRFRTPDQEDTISDS